MVKRRKGRKTRRKKKRRIPSSPVCFSEVVVCAAGFVRSLYWYLIKLEKVRG